MKLTRNPSDEELNEMIRDGDLQHLRRAIGALPEWARAAADRPDAFWVRQKANIGKRIAAAPRPLFARTGIAWAGVMALALLAAFLLNGSPAERTSSTHSDPDEELLVAVEQTVQSGLPQALEPAAMLAEEISSSQPTSKLQRVSKENRNEDQ